MLGPGFLGAAISSELRCCICMAKCWESPLNVSPLLSTCGHIFGSHCIDLSKTASNQPICPICQKPFGSNPDFFIRLELSNRDGRKVAECAQCGYISGSTSPRKLFAIPSSGHIFCNDCSKSERVGGMLRAGQELIEIILQHPYPKAKPPSLPSLVNSPMLQHLPSADIFEAARSSDIALLGQLLRKQNCRQQLLGQKDSNDMAALHYAAKLGSRDTVELLLNRGADVNIVDGRNWTALMYAAKNNDVSVARLLLEREADPFILNADHKRALDLTTSTGMRALLAQRCKNDANGLKDKRNPLLTLSTGLTSLELQNKKLSGLDNAGLDNTVSFFPLNLLKNESKPKRHSQRILIRPIIARSLPVIMTGPFVELSPFVAPISSSSASTMLKRKQHFYP